MKKYILFIAVLLALPNMALAAFPVVNQGTTTTGNPPLYFPQLINGKNPWLLVEGIRVSSTTATSTFANGINLTGGCFSVLGTCISGGSSGSTGTIGQVDYFTGTNTTAGTSSIFISTNQKIGIGTTSPFAKLSINPVAGDGDSLAIGSSSAPVLNVKNSGFVGLNSLNPTYRLEINDSGSFPFAIRNAAAAIFNIVRNNDVNVSINAAGVNVLQAIPPVLYWGNDAGVTGHMFRISGSDNTFLNATGLGAASTSPASNLTVGPRTANGSSTITMGKVQFDGYNAAGTRTCTFLTASNVMTTIAGACTQ